MPFSSGKYKATKPKPVKMGEFISMNRATKRNYNSSSTTEQPRISQANREIISQKNAGIHREASRESSDSYTTERKIPKESFENYLRVRHGDRHRHKDTDEPKEERRVDFKSLHKNAPRLILESDDPLDKNESPKRSQKQSPVKDGDHYSDSDLETKFPSGKKTDKGEKSKRLEGKRSVPKKALKGNRV